MNIANLIKLGLRKTENSQCKVNYNIMEDRADIISINKAIKEDLFLCYNISMILSLNVVELVKYMLRETKKCL